MVVEFVAVARRSRRKGGRGSSGNRLRLALVANNPVLPPRRVCPLCADDEQVTTMPAVDGWQYSCLAHEPPYTWTVAWERSLPTREGIAAELGLYDHLPTYVLAGEPWVEYGVIEYRFGKARPDGYRGLLSRWGHVAQGPGSGRRHRDGGRYSVSAFLARTLPSWGKTVPSP